MLCFLLNITLRLLHWHSDIVCDLLVLWALNTRAEIVLDVNRLDASSLSVHWMTRNRADWSTCVSQSQSIATSIALYIAWPKLLADVLNSSRSSMWSSSSSSVSVSVPSHKNISSPGATVIVRLFLGIHVAGLPSPVYCQLWIDVIFSLARCINKNRGLRGILDRNSKVARE